VKIPGVNEDREGFFQEIRNECWASQDDRISEYERLRSYYLWGKEAPDQPAIFNKIMPQMELLASFIFAAESTRFGIVLGESVNNSKELPKVGTLTKRLNGSWSDSNADVQFGQALLWSLVYNSMFLKMVQRGRRTIPMLVEPHQFGVLREDVPFLDDQDAFVHRTTVSRRSLERLLTGVSAEKRKRVMESVASSLKQEVHDMPAGLNRIIMSTFPMSGGPSGPGQLNYPYATLDGYRARIADERVEIEELWVWNDETDDYHVCTMASGGVCLYDRPNIDEKDKSKSMFLPQDHPFVQVCPNPSYDYFWGHSEVQRLIQLQISRETRMEQVMELLSRQVKPPATLKGHWQGIQDETLLALNVFGASASTQDPTADAKLWYPTVPPDVFAEIREIDEMFNEMTGLSNVTQGKGESGVRSKGHAAELARLGSSRIRQRAFRIEDSLDRMGGLYLRCLKVYDPEKLQDESGQVFTAAQFTEDCEVHVDGHSSSPIFVEDRRSLYMDMMEAQVIDGESFIDGLDPPNKQALVAKYQVLEAKRAAAAQAELAAKAAPGAAAGAK
jgi:hypothetical protein